VKHFLDDRRRQIGLWIDWRRAKHPGEPVLVPLRLVCQIRAKDGRPPRNTIHILKDLGGVAVREGHRIISYRFEP
jgi:hypothetical protein